LKAGGVLASGVQISPSALAETHRAPPQFMGGLALARLVTEPTATTPLMAQYERVKAQYPGHLVLFRVGDFYETFGDDARRLSQELDVVLTARAPDASGERMAMAGVPHHAVDTYLGRLVRKGYKVALCDQVEDARFAKGLVRREVTRVVTPGTLVEDRLLGGPGANYLACVVWDGVRGAYSVVDVSTGDWYHGTAAGTGPTPLLSALAGFRPREMIWSAPKDRGPELVEAAEREFPRARLEEAPALPETIPPEEPPSVAISDLRLRGYLEATQPRLVPFLSPPREGTGLPYLLLDAKSLRHLEIARPMNPDDPAGPTLVERWDATQTASGHRTLAFWLQHPLADVEAIERRLDSVEGLIRRRAELVDLRSRLSRLPDLGRIASRLAGRRIQSVDLAGLRRALHLLQEIHRDRPRWADPGGLLDGLLASLEPPMDLVDQLDRAVPDDTDTPSPDAPRFRPGFSPEIDRLRGEETKALGELAQLEREAAEQSGIRSLKIGYNQVFGYYFEVGKAHSSRVPPEYRRRQTLAQGERYTSDRLEEIERSLRDLRERLSDTETELWERWLGEIDAKVPALQRIGRVVGEVDVLAAFAHLAVERGYTRPVVDRSAQLVLRDARHPVLDRGLRERFVPNDTELDADSERMLVLTGPNMSGKSTYMRQVGLLVVLAQAGSFLPARYARIGLVSSLFTRMGFTDEIGRGKSSFMVEMLEVAEILRDADARSLILLDEIGRGTSTFDGVALAWATLRHLAEAVRCRTIVATHYHQLSALVDNLPGARNAHLAAQERPEGIVFLHRVVPGSTDRSYGLHVARLAGVPPSVLDEARRMLERLEEPARTVGASSGRNRPARYTQAILLTDHRLSAADQLVEDLHTLDLDRLSPSEALEWLRKQRQRIVGSETRGFP